MITQFNQGYEELAHHYGVIIDPARSGKPKDKPRIERMIPYIRDSFWSGREFSSQEEINRQATAWCLRIAGVREHGTTHQAPLSLFRMAEEKELKPLPLTPFEIVTWQQAKVALDCHIQLSHTLYSVPYQYVGKRVDVKLGSKVVEIYLESKLIKTHARGYRGQRVTDWNDYPPEKAAFFQRTPAWCRQQAALIGPSTKETVDVLLGEHALHYLRQCQGILRMKEKFGTERLERACNRANAFGDPSYRTVRTILERNLDKQTFLFEPVRVAGAFLRGPEESVAPSKIKRRIIMADLHQLENKMRMIKLSGMLETLNMRLDQAQKEGLAFSQFLEILLEDEVQHRANKRLATRLSRARFEEEKNLESFDFNFNPKLPATYIRELATCQFIERKESVILCGPVGVGKTHLAQALGHQACRAGYKVLFIKASRLLSDLGGGRADDTWGEESSVLFEAQSIGTG